MELIEKSVVDRRRAAREKGVDLDPTDPTKPMSIATTDFETGEKRTYTPQQALDAFKHAEKIKAAYGERARAKAAKAKKRSQVFVKNR